jgi:hypothetical protein
MAPKCSRLVTGRYVYRGDRWTDPGLRGLRCVAVRRADGKCVRGKNGNMLVEFQPRNGDEPWFRAVVLGRQLRTVRE